MCLFQFWFPWCACLAVGLLDHMKLQYFGHLMWRVDPLEKTDAGRDWGQEEKGTTEDEMAGWHHWLDGHESEWTPGVGDGQGGLACCDSWSRKESDTTEQLNWTELNWTEPFLVNFGKNWAFLYPWFFYQEKFSWGCLKIYEAWFGLTQWLEKTSGVSRGEMHMLIIFKCRKIKNNAELSCPKW